jgi:hypothetical protein
MMLGQILKSQHQDSSATMVLGQTQAVARATRIADFFDFGNPPVMSESLNADVRPKTPVPTIKPESSTKKK